MPCIRAWKHGEPMITRNVNECSEAWRVTGSLEPTGSAVGCTSWITIGYLSHGEAYGSEVCASCPGGEVDLSLGLVMASP